jgi:cytochrome c peroxidase
LLLGNSRVDRFRNSDVAALSSEERQGLWLFESKAGCWRCHQGENFTDDDFHNTGVQHADPQRDLGRFLVTQDPRDRFRYKTPSLRGLDRTSPYMHDGSLQTLAEVIEFYDRGGAPRDPDLDPQLKPLGLTAAEKQALVAFLLALSQ